MFLVDFISKYWYIILIGVAISLFAAWIKSPSGKGATGELLIRFVLGKKKLVMKYYKIIDLLNKVKRKF